MSKHHIKNKWQYNTVLYYQVCHWLALTCQNITSKQVTVQHCIVLSGVSLAGTDMSKHHIKNKWQYNSVLYYQVCQNITSKTSDTTTLYCIIRCVIGWHWQVKTSHQKQVTLQYCIVLSGVSLAGTDKSKHHIKNKWHYNTVLYYQVCHWLPLTSQNITSKTSDTTTLYCIIRCVIGWHWQVKTSHQKQVTLQHCIVLSGVSLAATGKSKHHIKNKWHYNTVLYFQVCHWLPLTCQIITSKALNIVKGLQRNTT